MAIVVARMGCSVARGQVSEPKVRPVFRHLSRAEDPTTPHSRDYSDWEPGGRADAAEPAEPWLGRVAHFDGLQICHSR